jgi:hypothetical protein
MGADHASRSLFEKMPTTSVDLVGLQFIRLMTRMWIVPAEMWGDINWENTGLAPHFTSAQATGEAFSTAEKVEVFREISFAVQESAVGTSRHFATTQHFGSFQRIVLQNSR